MEASFCRVDLDLLSIVTDIALLRFALARGGVACESRSKLKTRFLPSLDALRRDAGVILGDISSSESSSSGSVLDVGVLGRLEGARPLLPFVAALIRRGATFIREDLLTDFKAPGFTTFRCRLTVVSLVDLREPLAVRCIAVCRSRFETVKAEDRFIARSSRDAICLECSALSSSACSRAALVAASRLLIFAVVEFPVWTFRFLGGSVLLSDLARPDPRKSWSLRFVPAINAEASDLSSTGFFGLGPRTPRQDSVPQRHSCMFF